MVEQHSQAWQACRLGVAALGVMGIGGRPY